MEGEAAAQLLGQGTRHVTLTLPLLCRYRNFRTFTSPRPTQFSCVAVDASGEIVSAGAQDSFEIFVWSMQTGRLLDVSTLRGRAGAWEGPPVSWETSSGS